MYTFIYDERIKVTERNAKALDRIADVYDVKESTLITIWGYISQAILDGRTANERLLNRESRKSAERLFEEYDFLLKRYRYRLEDVAEILPELGCRAATPERLYAELISELS